MSKTLKNIVERGAIASDSEYRWVNTERSDLIQRSRRLRASLDHLKNEKDEAYAVLTIAEISKKVALYDSFIKNYPLPPKTAIA